MLAAVENHAAVVKALSRPARNVNARTDEYNFQKLTGGAGGIIHDRPQGGLTALILAARQGARESGEVLLAARRRHQRRRAAVQFTALQTAIFNGHYAFAKMLIEKGAERQRRLAVRRRWRCATSRRTRTGRTRRSRTPASAHLDIATLLLDKGADPNAPYDKTIPPRQAQGNINVPPGATPLYRAVRAVDLAAVKLLVERGANPCQAIKDGSTPMMAAAGLGAPRGGDEEVTEAGDRNDPVDVMKAAGRARART